MPLPPPPIDNRRYQDLLNEALARIPVHTPEWTNFGPADPGVTLIEVFAFLTENLLYRVNQIPERNRAKFLDLLGVPLFPATSAQGMVTIANRNGDLKTLTLTAGVEVRAGEIPFLTDSGLDVLPVDARLYLKRRYDDQTGARARHYNLLYASLKQDDLAANTELVLYETAEWKGSEAGGIDIGNDTVDGCLWLALLTRPGDRRDDMASVRAETRQQLAGRTLSLGIVPVPDDTARRLPAQGTPERSAEAALLFAMPKVPADGKLPSEPQRRAAEYRTLDGVARTNVLATPGIVEITLPGVAEMALWQDLDPLEAGSGDFPPALDDTALGERVVTWIRISLSDTSLRLRWAGINATTILQRQPVTAEVLGEGTGEPDQIRQLAHLPVLEHSVRVFVGNAAGEWDEWQRVADLLAAPPEVQPAYELRQPRADTLGRERGNPNVFAVDAESGQLRFGDGLRGRRPPQGARLRANYDLSHGLAGNVAAGAINSAPALPAGFEVSNPLPTWGGAPSEAVAEAQKQIPRYIQHRDRLVTAADFEAITLRTPGVQIGRVEVLPAFNPDLAPDAPGNAPGAVTLMLVPAVDPSHPEAPEPNSLFMGTVCRHLDARRLVTTELILRGPDYRDIWIAIGIELLANGNAGAEVREAVGRRIRAFLAPLRRIGLGDAGQAANPDFVDLEKGWPLRRAVSAAELTAVASRASGVRFVRSVRLANADGIELPEIPMHSLQLPRIAGLAVVIGDTPAPASLKGGVPANDQPANRRIVPVPVIPDRC